MKTILEKNFEQQYGHTPTIIVRSPGRVNIIGEHTDYNNGFVLPAAIDKAAYIAISLRNDDEIHLSALDLKETFTTTIATLKPIGDVSWPNFMLGAAAQFAKQYQLTKGFNAMLTSNIPMGAGLSSSAAVESAMVFGLNNLLQTNYSRIQMVQMAQLAEQEFAGVQCGIMDMFASVMGQKNKVIQLDCKTLNYKYVPFNIEGIKIVLFNTNVKHSLASSEYNTRRKECTEAVGLIAQHFPNVQSLRDVTEQMLQQHVQQQNPTAYKRSLFIVQEIQRLLDTCADLENGDIQALGKKMFATHEGLSNMYEVSCKELDFLVHSVHNNEAVIGARMMGGGFGGCTINLVKENKIDELYASIKPAYEKAMGLPLDMYIASIENGTEII